MMNTNEEKENQTVFKSKDKDNAQVENTSGLDQNVAALLTYAVGFITGIIFIFVEKENRFVRFHAFQSAIFFTPTFIVYIVLTIVLGFIPFIGWLLSFLLWAGFAALWIFLMIKAYKGEKYKLPFVGDIAEEQANK